MLGVTFKLVIAGAVVMLDGLQDNFAEPNYSVIDLEILDGSVAPIASNRTPNPPSEF